jgi:hypothetical protein
VCLVCLIQSGVPCLISQCEAGKYSSEGQSSCTSVMIAHAHSIISSSMPLSHLDSSDCMVCVSHPTVRRWKLFIRARRDKLHICGSPASSVAFVCIFSLDFACPANLLFTLLFSPSQLIICLVSKVEVELCIQHRISQSAQQMTRHEAEV